MREEEKLQVSEATYQTEKKAWEHDELKVRILSNHDTEDMLLKNQLKDFHYHEKHQKLLEIWFFRDFQGAGILGSNHS